MIHITPCVHIISNICISLYQSGFNIIYGVWEEGRKVLCLGVPSSVERNWVGVGSLWFRRELFIRYFRFVIDFIPIFSWLGGLPSFMRCVRRGSALTFITHGGDLSPTVFTLREGGEAAILLRAWPTLIWSFFLFQACASNSFPLFHISVPIVLPLKYICRLASNNFPLMETQLYSKGYHLMENQWNISKSYLLVEILSFFQHSVNFFLPLLHYLSSSISTLYLFFEKQKLFYDPLNYRMFYSLVH